jgi:hypothetical protein
LPPEFCEFNEDFEFCKVRDPLLRPPPGPSGGVRSLLAQPWIKANMPTLYVDIDNLPSALAKPKKAPAADKEAAAAAAPAADGGDGGAVAAADGAPAKPLKSALKSKKEKTEAGADKEAKEPAKEKKPKKESKKKAAPVDDGAMCSPLLCCALLCSAVLCARTPPSPSPSLNAMGR